MNEINLKHILIVALIPVVAVSLFMTTYYTILYKEFAPGAIIVISIFYGIPSIFFSITLITFLRVLNGLGLNTLTMSLVGQLVLSLVLALIFLTLWVWYEGFMYYSWRIDFYTLWVNNFKSFWIHLLYFGLTVPILLRFFMKRVDKNKT
jgi:hypothetical protein